MFFDIKSRFVLEVEASYIEYLELQENGVLGNGIDLRKGMEAASTLYHFGEHFAAYINVDFNVNLRSDINNLCPDYSILGNIVNVHKHNKIDRGKPMVTSTKNIKEVTYNIEYEDNVGKYYYMEKGIEITLINGEKRNLLDIMTFVINMWYGQMHKHGLINEIGFSYKTICWVRN